MPNFRYVCTFSSPSLTDQTQPGFQRLFDDVLTRVIQDVSRRPRYDGAALEASPSAWLQNTKRLATTFRGVSEPALKECMTDFKAAFAAAIHDTVEMKEVRIVVDSEPETAFHPSFIPPNRRVGGADIGPGKN